MQLEPGTVGLSSVCPFNKHTANRKTKTNNKTNPADGGTSNKLWQSNMGQCNWWGQLVTLLITRMVMGNTGRRRRAVLIRSGWLRIPPFNVPERTGANLDGPGKVAACYEQRLGL